MTHAPKIGALQAYAEDLLSDRGRARVDRHLAECEECRRALASIELYRKAVEDVRSAPAPALDWSKMELALAREARSVAATLDSAMGRRTPRRSLPRDGAFAIAIAAAAVLALALWPRPASPTTVATQEPTADRAVTPEEAAAPLPEAPSTIATVTLATGRAHALGPDGERLLEVGSEIRAGERITTDEGSSVHAAIGRGTGLALAPSSELVVTGVDGSIDLALLRGAVTSQIEPGRIVSGARFVVLAAEHRFEAHGTLFEVQLDEDVVRLEVAEGEVAVHPPDGTVVIVRAPGRWTNSGAGAASGAREIAAPHGLTSDASAWPTVRIERPGIVRWEVGEVRVEGLDAFAMRAPPGELSVAGFDAEGVAFRTVAIVGADGLSLGGDELVPEPPRVREGFIPQTDVVGVVEAGAPQLRRCYELALRTRPDLEAHAQARVTVAFDGSVARVQLRGDDLPPAIEQCVRTHLTRWTFPPPRGGSTFRFDLPLEFAAGR